MDGARSLDDTSVVTGFSNEVAAAAFKPIQPPDLLREYASAIRGFLTEFQPYKARAGQRPAVHIPLFSAGWDELLLPPPVPSQLLHALPPLGTRPRLASDQPLSVKATIGLLSSGAVGAEQELELLIRLRCALEAAESLLVSAGGDRGARVLRGPRRGRARGCYRDDPRRHA